MGAALQVHATPTFFINGVRIPIVKPEVLRSGDAYELKQVELADLKFGRTWLVRIAVQA